jgi:hypothetical protein
MLQEMTSPEQDMPPEATPTPCDPAAALPSTAAALW